MRKIQVSLSMAFLLCLVQGCASSKEYAADRWRDLADIPTVCINASVGARAQAGPFHCGLFTSTGFSGLHAGI